MYQIYWKTKDGEQNVRFCSNRSDMNPIVDFINKNDDIVESCIALVCSGTEALIDQYEPDTSVEETLTRMELIEMTMPKEMTMAFMFAHFMSVLSNYSMEDYKNVKTLTDLMIRASQALEDDDVSKQALH